MADRIEVHGLAVMACHGVLDFEKRTPQPFVLDITLEVDLLPAGQTDDLTASLSYADVATRALEICSGAPVDLVETLAERVARACLEWSVVEAVEVRVNKPQAPAGVAFSPTTGGVGGPAVTVRRVRSRDAVIALGTNIGRRVAMLRSAVDALRRVEGLDVVHVSPIVETDPVGGVEQPDFLNAVVVARTRLAPGHLMRELHAIEALHGRRRDVRWGPRTMDLDLIQLGTPGEADEVRCGGPDAGAAEAADSPLALPHPRAAGRAFVLAPWAVATPWARIRTGADVRTVVDVLADLDLTGVRPGPAWDAAEPFAVSSLVSNGQQES